MAWDGVCVALRAQSKVCIGREISRKKKEKTFTRNRSGSWIWNGEKGGRGGGGEEIEKRRFGRKREIREKGKRNGCSRDFPFFLFLLSFLFPFKYHRWKGDNEVMLFAACSLRLWFRGGWKRDKLQRVCLVGDLAPSRFTCLTKWLPRRWDPDT
jgi:hypothetical protein